MDTKQKTRAASQKTNARSTGNKNTKKKKSAGLLGMFAKQTNKRSTAAAQPQRARRSTAAAPQRTSRRAAEDAQAAQLRKEAEKARRQAEQAALLQQENGDEALPEEMVFTPDAQQEESRIRTPEENKRANIRRQSARRSKERKEEAKRAAKRPNVTYTDPVPFNLQKLLLQLSAVVAVVLAVVLGISVFFKVENVVVYGNKAYSAWTVQEASGIEKGENLLTFGSTRACGKITTALPYVETVRIGIKLPDTVNIYIEEFDVLYAIESGDKNWWLMTSGGKIVEKIDSGIANDYTKVVGVQVDSPTVGAQAKAVEAFVASQETTAEGETEATEEVFTVTGSDRLKAALLILDALELNDIVGEASNVNVQSLNNLELMYGLRYQVKLGDSNNMEYKIASMKQAVAQLNGYQTGILDVSFTTWTDRPGYTPYE